MDGVDRISRLREETKHKVPSGDCQTARSRRMREVERTGKIEKPWQVYGWV